MPQIQVGLDKWLEGQRTNPSIVTRIHALDSPSKEGPRTVIIPAGQQSFVSLDIPVGRYLFEAYLPSGETVTKTVSVTDAGDKTVSLKASESPHEWLSWQHLAARTPATRTRATAMKGATARKKTSTGTRARALPDAAPQDLLEVVTLNVPVAKGLLAVWKGASVKTLAPARVNVPPRTDSPQPLLDEALGVAAYLYGPGPWQEGQRYYAVIRKPPSGPALLATLPLPWHQADMSGDAAVDVLVDTSAEDNVGDWPVTVSVVVRDNIMGSVFGYLSAGDLPSAAKIVPTAVTLLAAKYFNALAAAGAAYVLVRSETAPTTAAKPPIWVSWLENLRRDFPALPDGSILAGWALLNGIGRARDVGEAAKAFIEAVDRGLPLYTAGVRVLFDGMTRVAAAPKKERPDGFDDAYEIVRRLALRIDIRQTFTVVRIG
jgi:hypothetical protein